MKSSEEIFAILKEKFGDAVLDLNTKLPKEAVIEVAPLKVTDICWFLRDQEELLFDNLILLTGLDDDNAEKVKLEDGTTETKGGTFSVVYHLESMTLRHKLVLRTSTSKDNPEVETVSKVWACADWHEREAFDMFGIKFLNHPDLRRILMPYDWEGGYPLRKDYKNPEFYQGMKVPY
ncbi:MAG: NADH-quinone oxidoreductase subunit C [Ignavibacteriaceae bacterium]|jgi:NADH-quinone oxidoreductase subunit C